MKCQTCADFVAGKCESSDHIARQLFEAEKTGDVEGDCDKYREREERPGPDEDVEGRVISMLQRLDESAEWERGNMDPETFLQARADDAARAWKGGDKIVPMKDMDAYPTRPGATSGDVMATVIKLLKECPELEKAKGERYRLLWRVAKWTSQGSSVWGQCKPISQANREKYGIPETQDLTISLPVWLLLDAFGRERLIHHELMHPASGNKGHPVAEFPETVARYGVFSKDQALLALYAVAHPQAAERIETWGMLPPGRDGARQLTLFAGDGVETVEVRLPMLTDRGVTEAVESLRPKAGSGVESVTLSSGGRSVTLTAKQAKKGIETIDKMNRKQR